MSYLYFICIFQLVHILAVLIFFYSDNHCLQQFCSVLYRSGMATYMPGQRTLTWQYHHCAGSTLGARSVLAQCSHHHVRCSPLCPHRGPSSPRPLASCSRHCHLCGGGYVHPPPPPSWCSPWRYPVRHKTAYK